MHDTVKHETGEELLLSLDPFSLPPISQAAFLRLPSPGPRINTASLHPNLGNIPSLLLPHLSNPFPHPSQNRGCSLNHSGWNGPFPHLKGAISQALGRMTKRLVPGPRPSHLQGSVAGLGQRPPLCQRQRQGYVERKVHSHSLRRPSISLCSSSFLR